MVTITPPGKVTKSSTILKNYVVLKSVTVPIQKESLLQFLYSQNQSAKKQRVPEKTAPPWVITQSITKAHGFSAS